VKKRFLKSAGVLSAATALAFLAGVGQASAASGPGWKVNYYTATKKVKVTDTAKDDQTIVVSFYDTVTKKYEYCRNSRGYGKAVTCQLHFPHGHRINGYANLLLNGTSYGDSDEFHFTS
jgi:hypothetical protein